jgi:hypothetical protein
MGPRRQAQALRQGGDPHYWLVEVDARTLEAFELDRSRWVLLGTYGEDARVAIPPFDSLEIEVSRLFLPKPASGPAVER